MSQNKGLYWHVHHQYSLFEYCYNARERRQHIRLYKSNTEIPIRLKLMKPIKNTTGFNRLINKLNALYEEENSLKGRSHRRLQRSNYEKYSSILAKIAELKVKLHESFRKVSTERHAKECPNCPWNGWTIFPPKEVEKL